VISAGHWALLRFSEGLACEPFLFSVGESGARNPAQGRNAAADPQWFPMPASREDARRSIRYDRTHLLLRKIIACAPPR